MSIFRRLLKMDAKKTKRFTIHIETPESTSSPAQHQTTNHTAHTSSYKKQKQQQPMVLVKGTRERPGFVQATVTLELDQMCEGEEVEIIFKAVVGSRIQVRGAEIGTSYSEQILQKKRWLLPVTKSGPQMIAAGRYTRQVFTVLEPSWPSSCYRHPEGFVQYTFQANITRTTATKLKTPLFSASQEFLVMNYSLPPAGLLPSPITHSTVVISPKKNVPIQVAIPSETVILGKRVPVTIEVQPFRPRSGFAGQEVVIMDARFGIQETRFARSVNHMIGTKQVKTFVEILVPGTSMGSWPQSRNGWKRTVHLTMPASNLVDPVTAAAAATVPLSTRAMLTPSLRSKYYDITHQLVIMLKLRTSGEKDKQAEEVEIRLDFNMAHPMSDDPGVSLEYHAIATEYHPVAAFSFQLDDFPFDPMEAAPQMLRT
ncbi:hypothetical protein BGZ54_009254 [Gamsiella multidivaricata]|nr:hypothetical protein BGZ54_009254 [Gamsiella multidivaricata]